MLLWILIVVAGIVIDQLSKYLVLEHLTKIPTLPLIENVLHFTYVENRGAAFGMLKDSRWVFMVLSTVAIVAVLGYLILKRPADKLLVIALSLVVSGGIGNMIDRIFLGYVVDFIDVRLIDFYVFNIADSCITVGACLMILYMILSEIKEYKLKKAAETGESAEADEENEAEND